MKQELMDAIQETPVIAAVKDDDGLQNALQNENIRVVFILYGDICNISTLVQRIHAAGKFAIVHVDLIAGLASKEVAVDFIRSQTEADGIISTRQSFIRRAKELGLAAILRVFLLDSISLESLGQDARQPPGLSGHPARHHAQNSAPGVRGRQSAGAHGRPHRRQRGCDGRAGCRCHRHFHHQSGGLEHVRRMFCNMRKKKSGFLWLPTNRVQIL